MIIRVVLQFPQQQLHITLPQTSSNQYNIHIYSILKTQTQIAMISLSRVNEPDQEETDQRVMTFPALNLEALRVAADTLLQRFIPAIPKIVTKMTSEVNNVSSSAELTQVV
ncbi:Hypothetical_protein [Hexamita inflata]|uniref:Hypothetical_protein n=1 Tax=Hexamita inflata TaxID=28002 RepID=A0ABP1HHY8_9EUKA